MFAEAIEDILRDHCTTATVRDIEQGGSAQTLWATLEDSGFLDLLAPEASGGAGLALPHLFPVLTTIGRYAMPVPLAQTIVARALLPEPGAVPRGMITLAPVVRHAADGSMHCPLIPFGLIADHVLAQEDNVVWLLSAREAVRNATGVPASLIASLSWPAHATRKRFCLDENALSAFAATLHAALMVGAMQRAFDMTLQYANERVQFGKSIGKFQAIQHQISVMAEHVAVSSVAAEAAFGGNSPFPSLLTAAIAKARTSEAAAPAASIAHAVHGAIGITEEYDLQLLTRRLHEWRMAHGSEAYWHTVVGQSLAESSHTLSDFVRAVYD